MCLLTIYIEFLLYIYEDTYMVSLLTIYICLLTIYIYVYLLCMCPHTTCFRCSSEEADVCWRMRIQQGRGRSASDYLHMPTYADVCAYSKGEDVVHQITCICWRMLTYADVRWRMCIQQGRGRSASDYLHARGPLQRQNTQACHQQKGACKK